MPIDDCEYTFQELAVNVLPHHMKRMHAVIATPRSMQVFSRSGIGPKSILIELNRETDFPGCYVLLENGEPVYVGISRTVVQRLCQHVKGKTHYDASLAYRVASERHPFDGSRKAAMEDIAFRKEFQRAKEYLASLDVAFIDIGNDLELHLFEVYCAMGLDTVKWNTFRTH